jgi:hypothetical protein
MTRINLANRNTEVRNSVTSQPTSYESVSCNSVSCESVSWGRTVRNNAGPLAFAAILIVCSLAVGCSSDKPQPLTSNNPAPITPPTTTMASNTAPAPLPEAKPAPKKVVKKRPATVTYTDKTYGVSFAYPRRYAIETGDATKDVLLSSPLPMNFVQPGGVALAAVELPETGFANTDFSSAFFDVSVNNALTADQCSEFSVPQPKLALATPPTEAESKQAESTPAKADTQTSKLMLGDLEMHSAEAVSGQGTSQSDSKYFHVFQNGACYEFALNITTNAAQADASLKHIDRDKLFARLESILSTVKIDPAKMDAAKIDALKTEAVKTDAAKIDGATNDATQPATSDSAPANASTTPDTQTAPLAAATPATTQSWEMPPQ